MIYLKSADASGMPSMKILDYTIRDQRPINGPVSASPTHNINTQEFATRADLATLRGEIDALKEQLKKEDKE